jgi:hypothetical protein
VREKPQYLSRELIGTIDHFITQLQEEQSGDSAETIAMLEQLRHELESRGTIPFDFGKPGADALWALMDRESGNQSE